MGGGRADPICQTQPVCAVDRRIRVLLADDQRFFLNALQLALAEEEWMEIVGCAANGEEAVQLVESLSPDLVLMDVAMPVLDGIAATRRIRELAPSSSVVILTGTDSPDGQALAREAGASGYVRKSSDLPKLVSSILALATLARHAGAEGAPLPQ
jgi:DNA-binding NarL/FixJ family response regulator